MCSGHGGPKKYNTRIKRVKSNFHQGLTISKVPLRRFMSEFIIDLMVCKTVVEIVTDNIGDSSIVDFSYYMNDKGTIFASVVLFSHENYNIDKITKEENVN